MSNIMCTVTSLDLLMVKLLFKSPSGLKIKIHFIKPHEFFSWSYNDKDLILETRAQFSSCFRCIVKTKMKCLEPHL